MEYYAYLNGAQRGPFTEEQMRAYLTDGLLQPSDLVSNQAGVGWKTLATSMFFPSPAGPVSPITTTPVQAQPPTLPPQASGAQASSTAPNESRCFKTSLHWMIFIRFALIGLLVFLLVALPFALIVQALLGSELGWFALPLPVFLLVPPAVAYAGSELVITNRRVLIKTGVIRRRTLELSIDRVESIAVDQGFLGRALDYGTVVIRGTGGFEEAFETIAQPTEFRNWVQRLQEGRPAASQ